MLQVFLNVKDESNIDTQLVTVVELAYDHSINAAALWTMTAVYITTISSDQYKSLIKRITDIGYRDSFWQLPYVWECVEREDEIVCEDDEDEGDSDPNDNAMKIQVNLSSDQNQDNPYT